MEEDMGDDLGDEAVDDMGDDQVAGTSPDSSPDSTAGRSTQSPQGDRRPVRVAARRRRTPLLWAIAIACGVLLVASALVVVRARAEGLAIVHPPREAVEPRPEKFGLTMEDVALETDDGLTLRAWYLPPAARDRAALIVTPGYGDHRGKAITTTAMLAGHGYGVLTFDWRAVGESEGDTSTVGYDEVRDVRAAVDWLAARPEVDPNRIGALSRSAGAAALITEAADDPRVRAVVAETTFSRLQDMVEMGVRAKTGLPAFPFAPLIIFFGEREAGVPIAAVRPVDAIGRLAPRPVLLIRAGRDTWVPAGNADLLYAAAGDPKELWDAPEAEHARVHDAYPEEYERRIVSFFDRYLGAAGVDAG
jgi:fermentation-respiration switch protein FrsA (DUF1100 family)